MDRLSVLDASFLERERPATPLHTGGTGIFGSDLGFERVLSTLADRIGEVPLARKVVRSAGALGGRPVWVDDPDFDLSYHFRHAALPPPGDHGQLAEFLARLLARPLDRDRPLWELYLIEGLEGDRRVVFRKVHLAMAGGDRGDPFGVLLDEVPEAALPAGPERRWDPAAEPGALGLAAEAARDALGRVAAAGWDAAQAATSPPHLARLARTTLASAGGMLARLTTTAPRSPLNRPLSAHRRLVTVAADLDDFRRVRQACGGQVNDVVLAVASDAVGRLLRWRGHDTTDLDLRVMVPVRVHGRSDGDVSGIGESRTVGDGVVGVLAPLPVLRLDPVARLYRIQAETAGLKDSRQAVAADSLVRLAGFAPAQLHAAAARLVSAEQRYHLALSNAPGPLGPRYLAGVRMLQTYPFLPLAGNSALSIAVTSYDGGLYTGFVGEREALSDLDLLAGFWTEALADLLAAAG